MFVTRHYCRTCVHLAAVTRRKGADYVRGVVNGKKKFVRVKHGEMYCANGDLFRINRNHVRWWGFARQCPLNPYTHTCLGCGQRMCTPKEVCSGCRKNNGRFNGNT